MPSFVGNMKVIDVGGIVQIGDTLQLSPQSSGKTFGGAGSFNTGDLTGTFTAVSNTNTNDQDVNDKNQFKGV